MAVAGIVEWGVYWRLTAELGAGLLVVGVAGGVVGWCVAGVWRMTGRLARPEITDDDL
jgi:hypothetical protein